MVNVDKAVIARLKTHGSNFEILVDCDNAIAFKGGKIDDIKEVLADQKVFSDSKKGLVASETQMTQIFSTSDPLEVANEIIRKGEIQLTAEYKSKLIEEKRKRILAFIQKNGIDPKTSLPHPLTRLELAFEEAKVKISEYKSEKDQIEEIMDKLRPILPIKFAKKEIAIRIPADYTGKAYSALKSMTNFKKEDWGNDGSFMCVVEIPAGMQDDLFDKVNNLTQGNADLKILKIID